MENFLIFSKNSYWFLSSDLKLHDRYCHREKYSFLGKKRKISSDTLILKWLVAPMNFAINNLPLMTQFATFGETTICLLLLSLSSDLCSLTIFFSLHISICSQRTWSLKMTLLSLPFFSFVRKRTKWYYWLKMGV